MWADGGPIDPSPTIDQAIAGGYPWLEIECSRCKTLRDVDLAALSHVSTTFVHDLVDRLRCSKCAKAGRRPAARLLQLTDDLSTLQRSTGNPVARTYWRWRLTWNPFGVYKPASSAVGLYQMTDAAYAEASRYCIRRHAVVDADCWFNSLSIRAVPSHAIELAAVYLDRSVAAVLADAPDMTASLQEKRDLAAFIHLCGGGPARAFVRRGFQVMAGERCGDHLVTAYLAKVNAMKRQFLRLAVNNQN
jgi:phage FluMu protein Com